MQQHSSSAATVAFGKAFEAPGSDAGKCAPFDHISCSNHPGPFWADCTAQPLSNICTVAIVADRDCLDILTEEGNVVAVRFNERVLQLSER